MRHSRLTVAVTLIAGLWGLPSDAWGRSSILGTASCEAGNAAKAHEVKSSAAVVVLDTAAAEGGADSAVDVILRLERSGVTYFDRVRLSSITIPDNNPDLVCRFLAHQATTDAEVTLLGDRIRAALGLPPNTAASPRSFCITDKSISGAEPISNDQRIKLFASDPVNGVPTGHGGSLADVKIYDVPGSCMP